MIQPLPPPMPPPRSEETQTLVLRRPAFETAGPSGFPEDLRRWQPAVALAQRVREALNQPLGGPITRPAEALPEVLLGCLATGSYSSTDIAALCDEEPMCRYLAGGRTFVWGDVRHWRRERRAEVAAALARLLKLSRPSASPSGPDPDFSFEAERRLDLAMEADHRDAED